MKANKLLLFAGALLAAPLLSLAQIIEFRATIDAAQETPASTSSATGAAVMLYDVGANTFDLVVTINNFSNPLTASHVHEGAVGAAGAIVTNLGAESAYTRSGNTLTATFLKITHGGAKLTLLQNGAYVNFHSAAFPGGEVRGQLIAQPKRLVANFTVAQEQAAFPAVNIVSNSFGGAVISYNPGTNRITTRINIYNFLNTFTNSHYHEGAPGVSGSVVHGLGGAAVYTALGAGAYSGLFSDQAYLGDPVKLLTGGAYLNFHSNLFGGGEVRGQVRASDEVFSTRTINTSALGTVGAAAPIVVNGFVITGSEPLFMRIIARGPSLARYGVTGGLSNPTLSLYNSAAVLIATNDNHTLAQTAVIPPFLDANDSVLDVILPPGAYTAIGSGVGGATGIVLVEAFDQR